MNAIVTDVMSPVTDVELAEISAMLGDLSLDGAEEAVVRDVIEEEGEPDTIEGVVVASETLPVAAEPEAIEAVAETPSETLAEAIELAAEPELDLAALDEAIESAVQELDLKEAREEAYANQEAGAAVTELIAPVEAPSPTEAPPAAEAPVKAKKEKAPAAPRLKASIETLPAESFILETGDASDDPAALDANKTAVIARRPAQKKVAEKFENAILAIAAGRAPSVYTLDCYRVLKASGETTSAGLAAALTATKKRQDVGATYTIGTARSQAGQFMALAPALKIAKREGNKLILNPDSLIAMALDALIGA